MAFNVENGTGATLEINDLGITLGVGEITDISIRVDPLVIALSAEPGEELHVLITAGDLIIKDPLLGTDLSVADGITCAQSHNDPHFRVGPGARIGDVSDVTLTSPAADEILRYDGSDWVNSPAVGGFSGLGIWRYRTETTSTPTVGRLQFDNTTIDSATELYVNVLNDNSVDMTAFLSLISSGDLIYLQLQDDASQFVILEVGTSSLLSGVFTFPITNIEAQGTTPVNNARIAFVVTHSGSGGGGDPDQNLWETIVSDSGSAVANTTTDSLSILGGVGTSTAIVGDTLTITNDDPNVDQNLWETVASDSGSAIANTITDTLTIAGGTGISTAVSGDTLTITNDDPNVDQNLWETIVSDSGSAVANTTTDSLSIVGGTGISTAVSGDTLTITATGGGSTLIFQDEGTPVANTPHTTANFVGAGVTATDGGAGVATITIPGGAGSHDLDSHTDVTITGVGDNNRLVFDSGSGQWVNVGGPPSAGIGGAIVSQLFWGPIPSVVGTTVIPNDLTLPDITEGTEIWSQALTLNESTSTVRIATNCTTSSSSASIEFVFAIFRDSLCIGTAVNATSNKDSGFAVSFEIYDEPGAAGLVTYSVRIGKSGGGGTWSINEIGGDALFAGTMQNNSFSVEEINVIG